MSDVPRLYRDLASWFHLLTQPENYREEAEFARQQLGHAGTVLELGAGGGNNAFHLKTHFQMTLSDMSSEMLDNSRRINPECEHVVGDMKSLRLGRQFDAVFIHDAIGYILTERDLRAALETAFVHCKPGGTVLIMPDYLKETFRSGVHHGGADADCRSLRYIEWTFDPDPTDTTYTVDFAYMLREGAGPVTVVHDPHTCGVFARGVWLRLLEDTGFKEARCLADEWGREVFVAQS